MALRIDAPLTVVTAADAPYARCVEQLLMSAVRHRVHRSARWIVYDLGLTSQQRTRLKRRFGWASFRRFEFENYPPHFAVGAGHYAWKPAIIRDVVRENGDFLLWLDSATVLRDGFDEPLREIDRHGIYAASGQACLAERCSAAVLRELDVPLEVLHMRERVSGVLGFNPLRPAVLRVIDAWFGLASNPKVSRPVHNTPPVHKPQSLLSIVLLTAEVRGDLSLPDVDIDISSGRPLRWMSSRNLVSNTTPAWADPAVRLRHWTYKAIDQLLWRIKGFEDRRMSGWYRILREHFALYVARASQQPVHLPAPAGSYYADPFPLQAHERQWLLVEEFRYGHNRGRIVLIALDDMLNPGPVRPLDTGEGHASFPFVFRSRGRVYVLPETNARKSLDLYELNALDANLRRVRRLLYGVDASDSILFEYAGRYWIITSQRDSRAEGLHRYLAIYHFDDLERGPLQAHPINAQRLYGNRPYSWGRCAGSVWWEDGRHILRPIHSSTHYYGQSIAWMRITELTPETFKEEPTAAPNDWPILGAGNFHHLGVDGNLLAGDLRDRTSAGQGLAALLRLSRRPLRPPDSPA